MSSKALRKAHIGYEGATPGVETAPTYVLPAVVELKVVADKIVVDENIGSFAPSRHYLGSKKSEGSLEFSGTYEQAHQVAAMALGDGVDTASSGLRQWVFTLPDGTVPDFATFTVEYTDGNEFVVRSTDVFATSLEVSGEAGKEWVFNADLEGANVEYDTALTGSLTPLPRTGIVMADTNLYINPTWATLGNTLVSTLISFTWKIENYQHHKQFAGSLYATGRGNDRWDVSLELVLEVEDANTWAEVQKHLSTDLSAIRISATKSGYTAKIEGMFYLDEVDTLDDRDGNNILKLTYKGQKDSSNNTGKLTFITPLAVL